MKIASAMCFVLALQTGAALASAADKAVVNGPVGGGKNDLIDKTEVPAGSPMLGVDVVTAADIREVGAKVEPARDEPKTGLSSVASASYPEGDAPSVVIGWDSRVPVKTNRYPTRAIVYIELNGVHHCTGFMISSNTVATAGHCVHSGGSGGSWYNRATMRVFAGRDGANKPNGSCTVRRLHSVVGWTQNRLRDYDYGAMRLNCTIGSKVGWFGMYGKSDWSNEPAIVSGYPGDKPKDQWLSADKVRASTARVLLYRVDTIGGHSGSPIWSDRDGVATTGTWAYGIHTFGDAANRRNGGTRLVAPVINNYINWINLPN